MKKLVGFSTGFVVGLLFSAVVLVLVVSLPFVNKTTFTKDGFFATAKETIQIINTMSNEEENNDRAEIPKSLEKKITSLLIETDKTKHEDDWEYFKNTGSKEYWWSIRLDQKTTNELLKYSPKEIINKEGLYSIARVWYDQSKEKINIIIYLNGSKEEIFHIVQNSLYGNEKERFLLKADLKGFEKRHKPV